MLRQGGRSLLAHQSIPFHKKLNTALYECWDDIGSVVGAIVCVCVYLFAIFFCVNMVPVCCRMLQQGAVIE